MNELKNKIKESIQLSASRAKAQRLSSTVGDVNDGATSFKVLHDLKKSKMSEAYGSGSKQSYYPTEQTSSFNKS